MKYDCIITGGGASGLMLAAQLNISGHSGLVLEATGKLGSKLLMSGGGHCNITHAGSIRDFLPAYGDAGRRLRKCLYRHNNLELIRWLEDGGVPTVTNDEGRVFPASMKSADVLNFLINRVKANGWEIRNDSKVTDIALIDRLWNLSVSNSKIRENLNECRSGHICPAQSTAAEYERITTDNLVIAGGGVTYPETGSDGSLFEILRNIKDDAATGNHTDPEYLNIRISEPHPALAPISVTDYPYAELSGISIPDVTVTAFGSGSNSCKGKVARMTGSLLFTHDGFSGPVILNISGYAEVGEALRISYNKSPDELPRRMRRILEDRSRGASGDIKTNKLAALLDSDDFVISAVSERGMVTRGGIDLSQIDLSSMEIRFDRITDSEIAGADMPSMFAIGEAIDADGITGGYNLQLCYSTACAVADALNAKLNME